MIHPNEPPAAPEWTCSPHRMAPHMETPTPEPREDHLVRGTN